MCRFHRSAAICLAFVISFTANSRAANNWLEVRSKHFSLVTDAGQKRGIEVAQRCEQMRAAFSLLMHRAQTQGSAPLLILAFKNESELDDVMKVQGARSRHSGIFLPGTEHSFILLDVSGDPWHAVYHEYAHELLRANISAPSTWFDEGFAEYFSTFGADSRRVLIGRVPLDDLRFLRQNGKLMKLRDLVSVNQDSNVYWKNGPLQSIFYAESWLLVHYLFDHQLIGHVEPFDALVSSGVPLDEAVKKAFGMSASQMEDDLLAYAKGEQFRYFSLPAVQSVSLDVGAIRLKESAASALKDEIRWYLRTQHTPEQVRAYSEQMHSLIEHDPETMDALRGLGLGLAGKEVDGKNSRSAELRPAPGK